MEGERKWVCVVEKKQKMKAHFSFSVSLKRDLSVGSLRGTGERS